MSSVGSGDVEDDRARLSALFGGGPPPEESAESGAEDVGKARESGKPAKGAVLVANPQRFCSRNPFARAVKDAARQGNHDAIVQRGGVTSRRGGQLEHVDAVVGRVL